jgi:5-methylcytosine-specific restriction enzyme A
MQLAAEPLCRECMKALRITEATEVHHVLTIRDQPALRLSLDNLMSLCRRCHSTITASESGQFSK